MIKFSKTSLGFYSLEVNGENIPPDAVDVSDELYAQLKQAQLEGKVISADLDGNPIAVNESLPNLARKLTPLEFLEKFNQTEQLAVVAATRVSDPMKLWYDKMLASTFVDLNDPRTSEGLTALVAEGLITQSRYNEIMGLEQ